MRQLSRAIIARMLWVVFALIFFLVVSASQAHDVYSEWKDKHGQPCCGGNDCKVYPADKVHIVQTGFLLADGVLVRFDEAIGSPDENYHRCDYKMHKARCFAVPGGW